MRVLPLGALLLAAIAASCHSTPPSPATPRTVVAVPVSAPLSPAFGAKDIDAMLRAEWKKEGIAPAPAVDDARFLRRVYLDVVGTIPAEKAVLAFIADAAPDKRAKVVAQLVSGQGYADHWTNYWDDELIGPGARGLDLDRAAFRGWLHARFASNAPWNEVVYELVTATGLNSSGGPRKEVPEVDPAVNGAVNWLLKYEQSPQDLAGSASRTFLGVQIQCAQCHDHKSEKWKQDDFRRFAACFARARIKPLEAKQMGATRRVEVENIGRPAPRYAKDPELKPIGQASPAAIDGTDLSRNADVRQALGTWMTAKENPWFAKAIVNRMWGHFLGRGFIDPVDDMRPSTTPTMAPLMDKLAVDFAAHGYDLRRLIETICATEAYQLASTPPVKPGTPDPENRLWSRFHLTPMGPEELLNALFAATNVESAMKHAGIGNVEQLRAQLVRQYAFLFDVDEDVDQASFEGTVSQALSMLNGSLVGVGGAAVPGGTLAEVLWSGGNDPQKIESLYLRTLSRRPTSEELQQWTSYIASETAHTIAPPIGPPPVKKAGPRKGPRADPRAGLPRAPRPRPPILERPRTRTFSGCF